MVGRIKALVIGGSGCLGKEIVCQLVADGSYTVHSLDILLPPEDKRLSGVASYIRADITNKSDMSRALEGIEVVFHTASLLPNSIRNTPRAMEKVNVEGTKNIIRACEENGVKRLIYTSTCSVSMSKYGKNGEIEESFPLPEVPIDAYVATKGAAEMLVRNANTDNGLRTCAIRPGALVGGKNNPSMTDFMASEAKIVGKGDYLYPWVTLKAASKVHLIADRHLAKKPVSMESNAFNVISANTRYRDLKTFFSQQNGGKEPEEIPLWMCIVMVAINGSIFWLTGHAPFGDGMHAMILDFFVPLACSTKHTERELGWVEHRPWQEVIKETIVEYRNGH